MVWKLASVANAKVYEEQEYITSRAEVWMQGLLISTKKKRDNKGKCFNEDHQIIFIDNHEFGDVVTIWWNRE